MRSTVLLAALGLLTIPTVLFSAPITVSTRHKLQVEFGELTSDSVRYSVASQNGQSEAGEIHCVMLDIKYNRYHAGGHWDNLPHTGTIKFGAELPPKSARCKLTGQSAHIR